METLNASDFKAKCLAVLDRVRDTGEGVVILKRGKPVARLMPVSASLDAVAQEALKGSVTIVGDVVAPVLPEEAWEALAPE